MYFRADPDLVLPPDTAWGPIGKIVSKFLMLFDFFGFQKYELKLFLMRQRFLPNCLIMIYMWNR